MFGLDSRCFEDQNKDQAMNIMIMSTKYYIMSIKSLFMLTGHSFWPVHEIMPEGMTAFERHEVLKSQLATRLPLRKQTNAEPIAS